MMPDSPGTHGYMSPSNQVSASTFAKLLDAVCFTVPGSTGGYTMFTTACYFVPGSNNRGIFGKTFVAQVKDSFRSNLVMNDFMRPLQVEEAKYDLGGCIAKK